MDELQKNFFGDIFTVLQSASSKCRTLDEKFPSEFYEPDPNKIYDSYVEFLRHKFDENPNIKLAEDIESTSIAERFSNRDYLEHEDAVYRLYHDVKLVCSILIHYYSQGTRSYQMVDKFYKFASELILRECYRVGSELVGSDDHSTPAEESDFSKAISKDFIKITQVYQLPIAETYHTQSKDGHLFSSVISRSVLDQRPKGMPHDECDIVRLVPQASSLPANRLGFVAANTSHVPDPTISPTEIMTSFLHPNWYPLPTTKWLDYGNYQSFAPSISEFKSVIDSSRKGQIWLEKIGYKYWKKREANSKSSTEQNDSESGEHTEKNETMREIKKESLPDEKSSNQGQEQNQQKAQRGEEFKDKKLDDDVLLVTNSSKPVNVNLKNIYEWMPSNKVSDEVMTAFEEGNSQKLLTSVLTELKKLKSQRVKINKISKPTSIEVDLYHKAQTILREAMLSKQISVAPRLYERQFPVLQNNYSGTVPVLKTIVTRKKKSKKFVN